MHETVNGTDNPFGTSTREPSDEDMRLGFRRPTRLKTFGSGSQTTELDSDGV